MGNRALGLVKDFLRHVDPVLGSRYSAVLYGSAARGDWEADRSDINLLLVADALDAAALRGLGPPLTGLPEAWRSLPLIMERGEWERAGDVFPIELTDMHLAHLTLRGADPLIGMRADPASLRTALEREFRTKLLRLRQGYAVRAADPAALGRFAAGTLGAVLVLARATLVLTGRPVPSDTAAVVEEFAAVTGAPAASLRLLLAHRSEQEWSCTGPQFEDYLAAVATATAYLDLHQPGVP